MYCYNERIQIVENNAGLITTTTVESISVTTSDKATSPKFKASSQILDTILAQLYSQDEIQGLNVGPEQGLYFSNSKSDVRKIPRDFTIEQGM